MTFWVTATDTEWKVLRGYSGWHVCLFERKEHRTVQTIEDAKTVYNFLTLEVAQDCLYHMKMFDSILQEFKNRDITYSKVKLSTDKNFQIGYPYISCGWRCELFGMGSNIVIKPTVLPHWFWRKMQYLVFGNKWVKEK